MRIGIRTKQVAGVTAVVALAAMALSTWYVASLARFLLEDSRSNAELLAKTIYQRTFEVVSRGGDPIVALQADDGLRNILEATAYSEWVEYAVIVDPSEQIITDADKARVGTTLGPKNSLDDLITQGPVAQLRAIYTPGGRTLEIREPLAELGSIRVGVSTLLLRSRLAPRLFWPLLAALGVVGVSLLVSILLAQVVLRPIHVIRSGLARLGRGELGVNVDLPADAELAEIGTSFQKVSAQLSAGRTGLAGQQALESVVDQLEDAVALFGTDGTLLFSNAAMDASIGLPAEAGPAAHTAPAGASMPPMPKLTGLWTEGHPYRAAVERALSGAAPAAPAPVEIPQEGQRLVLTHLVPGAAGAPLGVVLVSRNLAYLSQVESTLSYSRKLAALSRLTAGIAHEIKNPLNATMIHLELLRMQLADQPEALQNVAVIADQVRRLDDVVQGFMKFTRPEDLHLQAVDLAAVFERLRPVLEAEAGKHGVELRVEVPGDLPPVEGDPNLLEQAFLNLALNAYQAMPDGGRLRIGARAMPGRVVAIEVEDTGVGIAPEHLPRIFDLYFTTKIEGSGIGLSLVFRTVQLHDGEIEVQSTPGRGTTFRILLRQAARMFQTV
jgi:signal transduction histidine kinase